MRKVRLFGFAALAMLAVHAGLVVRVGISKSYLKRKRDKSKNPNPSYSVAAVSSRVELL